MSARIRSKRFRIHDKWWTVRIQRPPDKTLLDGQCDYDARTIYLRPEAIEADAIDIIAHELAHAVLPAVDEDHVHELGVVISQVAGWVGKATGGKLSHGYSGRA